MDDMTKMMIPIKILVQCGHPGGDGRATSILSLSFHLDAL